jgi:hypothetical protein
MFKLQWIRAVIVGLLLSAGVVSAVTLTATPAEASRKGDG